MNILITGATGFIGQAIVRDPRVRPAHRVSALTRLTSAPLSEDIARIEIGNLDGSTDYSGRLAGIDVIIHLAARVHCLKERRGAAYPAYKSTNIDGTLNLASQAAASGVGRFIYLSSIKVNGEATPPGHPFKADDQPNPSGPYAESKLAAERGLQALSETTDMEHVIIRPPLVYGPGVKANFQKLMGLIHKGVPIPLGSIDNLRSMVSSDNLTSLIRLCIDHPNAANKIFLVSDDRDVSTTELLRKLAHAMELPARLIATPKGLIKMAALLLGKREMAYRLLDNLQVDISKTKSDLVWRPVTPFDEAIRNTALDYLQHIK